MDQSELAQLHHEAERELKKIPGVVGVGYGFKETGGKLTKEVGFCVYVKKKKPQSELRTEEIIPERYKGVITDVLEVPEIEPLDIFQLPNDTVCSDHDSHSPLISGITIFPFKVAPPQALGVGTLGFFAQKGGSTDPHDVVLVSCNHVLTDNGAGAGDTVYQPQLTQSGGMWQIDTDKDTNPVAVVDNVGQKGDYNYQYPNEPSKPYYLDCATAKLNICISKCWCTTNCGESFSVKVNNLNISGNNSIAGVDRVQQSDIGSNPYFVYKSGRTTGVTLGQVIRVDVPIPNGNNTIEIMATVADCSGTLRFADSGDSGSPLINSQSKLIGIVFAKSKTDPANAFACHIHPALAYLNVVPFTTTNAGTGNPAFSASAATQSVTVASAQPASAAPMLRERLLETEPGPEILKIIQQHNREVVHLVNHCRRVTVAWHRNKGPQFLENIVANAHSPEHVVPNEIDGVTREMLLRQMARVLTAKGSHALRDSLERYLDEVLAYGTSVDGVHDLLQRLPQRRSIEHRSAGVRR